MKISVCVASLFPRFSLGTPSFPIATRGSSGGTCDRRKLPASRVWHEEGSRTSRSLNKKAECAKKKGRNFTFPPHFKVAPPARAATCVQLVKHEIQMPGLLCCLQHDAGGLTGRRVRHATVLPLRVRSLLHRRCRRCRTFSAGTMIPTCPQSRYVLSRATTLTDRRHACAASCR